MINEKESIESLLENLRIGDKEPKIIRVHCIEDDEESIESLLENLRINDKAPKIIRIR